MPSGISDSDDWAADVDGAYDSAELVIEPRAELVIEGALELLFIGSEELGSLLEGDTEEAALEDGIDSRDAETDGAAEDRAEADRAAFIADSTVDDEGVTDRLGEGVCARLEGVSEVDGASDRLGEEVTVAIEESVAEEVPVM